MFKIRKRYGCVAWCTFRKKQIFMKNDEYYYTPTYAFCLRENSCSVWCLAVLHFTLICIATVIQASKASKTCPKTVLIFEETWRAVEIDTVVVIYIIIIIFNWISLFIRATPFLQNKAFEDANAVIRSCQSKDIQFNGHTKTNQQTNYDLQNTTQKTKNWATQTPRRYGPLNLFYRDIWYRCTYENII
jgi:hypothetical protein